MKTPPPKQGGEASKVVLEETLEAYEPRPQKQVKHLRPLAGDVLSELHQEPDSVVMFYDKKSDSKFQKVGAATVAELEEILANSPLEGTPDRYCTMNSFFAPRSAMEKNENQLWKWSPSKEEKNLRQLNACYLDIDCGRASSGPKGMSPLEAEFQVRKAAEHGVIPTPSGFIHSGQGIWVLWLLKPSRERCQAGTNRLLFFKEINRAIAARLPQLAIDEGAIDGSRLVRFPNSINSNSGKTVRWSFQGDHNGTYRYDLDDLGTLLGVSKPQRRNSCIRRKYPKNHKPNRGYKILNEKRERDWRKIFRAGHVVKGHRSFALHSVARHLIALGKSLELLRKLRKQCKPTLELSAVDSIIRSYRDVKPHHLFADKEKAGCTPFNTDKTILRRLKLSKQDVSDLGLETITHKEKKVPKKQKVELRRERLHSLLAGDPDTPRKELASLLGVSLRTLERDLSFVLQHWPTTTPHHATEMAGLNTQQFD